MVFRKIFFALLVAFTFTACTTNDPIIDNQVKTDGALTVQLTTSTYNGEYSPEHVLAIWIESNNGTFVKSLKVGAAERKKYLTNWLGSTSSGNTTDAVTSATLRNHVTHNLNWDGTDVKGAVVGDGSYKLCVEFTEDDRTGKYTTFAFTKGVEKDQQTPSAVSGVSNVQITWTPQ
ncbi:MAG: DUF2271 domain-containing protein [Bacteroidia bacterium]|jgi:hypothetical protein|nr:DUF2271 domain-containing protein [Paludibacteraceae bacterium]NCB68020.1 DUF2271 domain-containing protein [Bacteroidia bacterium]